MKRAPSTLQALGFSEIEALVYCYLLTNAPATGYRVSRGIGKPVANTYKAISDLKNRGVLAVAADDKIAVPVSPEELLRRLDGEFHRQREEAAVELAKLARELEDEHIYRLNTMQQVLDRARDMIERAREIILIDAFPGFWGLLRPHVSEALARGVKVLAKIYAENDLQGITAVRSADAQQILSMWPGHQLNLVIDALEHLMALGSRDMAQIYQAIWSNSIFVSCTQYNHLWSEMVAIRYLECGEDSKLPRDDRLLKHALTIAKPAGVEQLKQRYIDNTDKVVKRSSAAARPRVARSRGRKNSS
jgi:HTH-type transcriptional regulator, sugar sensing transcriptional regulator